MSPNLAVVTPEYEPVRDIARLALIARMHEISLAHYQSNLRFLREFALYANRGTPPLVHHVRREQPTFAPRLLRERGIRVRDDVEEMLRPHGGDVPPELEETLLPDEVLSVVAAIILASPRDIQRRLKQYAGYVANIPYRPSARSGRVGQVGYTRGGVEDRLVPVVMLSRVLVTLRKEYEFVTLAHWHEPLDLPEVRTNPRSGRRKKHAASLESVRARIGLLDDEIATRCAAKWRGKTDREMSWAAREHDFEARPVSARSRSVRHTKQKWLRQVGLVTRSKDRAICALLTVTGFRPQSMVDLRVGDVDLDVDYGDLPIQPSSGSGAILAPAVKDTRGNWQPARLRPLGPEASRRLEWWLWVYSSMAGLSLEAMQDWPLFPGHLNYREEVEGLDGIPSAFISKTFAARFSGVEPIFGPKGSRGGSIALFPFDVTMVGKTLDDLTRAPKDAWRGPGGMGPRRFVDRSIWGFWDRYAARHPELPAALTGVVVKEVVLNHATIPGDPYEYTGLGDEDTRVVLSYYGALLMEELIYGDLETLYGPDRQEVREAQLVLAGAVERSDRVRRRLDETVDELRSELDANSSDVDAITRLSARLMVVQHDLEQLRDVRDEWTERLHDLVLDESLWVALPPGEAPLTSSELRQLMREAVSAERELVPEPLLRNFLVAHEFCSIFGVSMEKLRRWRSDDPKSAADRPWPAGRPPVVMIDKRTVLVHPGGLFPDAVTPERERMIRRALMQGLGRGWKPGGKKLETLTSQTLSPEVVRLNSIGLVDRSAPLRLRFADEGRSNGLDTQGR